jgi:MarR family transcriptional regulator for hemolysin
MSRFTAELCLLRGRTCRPVTEPSRDTAVEASIHESPRLDDAVAYRIHRTNRLLLTHLARFIQTSQHGLTPEKWFILARLRQDSPLHQVELTEPALEDAPNVSRLVESLVGAGLVERHPDPKDRRNRILKITPEGASVADELHKRSVIERRRVFDGFTETDLTALTETLDRLDANIRPALKD